MDETNETLSLDDYGTLKMDEPWSAPVGPENDPDRWQGVLPQPYRMIDELLGEMIDDVLLSRVLKEANERREAAKPCADSESGAAAG